MTPLISVVIPTLNAEATLAACLESLYSQGFKGFDVWIIDGGSTDDSVAVAHHYQRRSGVDLHIKSSTDSGVYDAMNKAISLCRGEWLFFLGADDVLVDEHVFSNMSCNLIAPYEFVYGDVVFSGDGSRYAGEFSLDRLLFEQNICQQAIFYKRTLLTRIGGFSLRYPIWGDWDLNIRCFRCPDVETKWVDQLVSVYNSTSGISRHEDPVFKNEIPATLQRKHLVEIEEHLEQIVTLKKDIMEMKKLRSYRLGQKVFGWLDRLF